MVVSSRDSEVKSEKKEAELFDFEAWPNCSSCTIRRLTLFHHVLADWHKPWYGSKNLLSRGSRAHEHMKVGLHARLEVHKFRHVLIPLFNNINIFSVV